MQVSASVRLAAIAVFSFLAACSKSDVTSPPTPPAAPIAAPAVIEILGRGDVGERYTAEVSVRGNLAYTTTWGTRSLGGVGAVGNAIKIWNVAGNIPVLIDSVIVPQARTLGDVEVTDDGQYLVVATEFQPGAIVIYSLANPEKPVFVSRFANADTDPGVHTAEIQRVNGVLYGFLSIDQRTATPARLVIVNLSNPAAPLQVFSAAMGQPFVHDVFVRDGILFTALWNAGVEIFDIGGGGKSGTPSNPVSIGKLATVGGQAHNIWWYHDATGSKKYAFVGQEGPGAIGASSAGDIHVIDVSNMSSPKEVAFFNVPGAGTHNFSVDEAKGILYAAYYNAGVQAIDVRGDLGTCTVEQRSTDGRCNLAKMGRSKATGLLNGIPVYVWGVQIVGTSLYASDMLNGLWKLRGL